MTSKVATVETTSSDSSPKSSPGAEAEMTTNNAEWRKKIDQQMVTVQNSMNHILTFMSSIHRILSRTFPNSSRQA